jgi:hypothetical protein
MCFEDLVKRRHHPKSRAGNIRQLLALCQRGSRVDLDLFLTFRRSGPGKRGELISSDIIPGR